MATARDEQPLLAPALICVSASVRSQDEAARLMALVEAFQCHGTILASLYVHVDERLAEFHVRNAHLVHILGMDAIATIELSNVDTVVWQLARDQESIEGAFSNVRCVTLHGGWSNLRDVSVLADVRIVNLRWLRHLRSLSALQNAQSVTLCRVVFTDIAPLRNVQQLDLSRCFAFTAEDLTLNCAHVSFSEMPNISGTLHLPRATHVHIANCRRITHVACARGDLAFFSIENCRQLAHLPPFNHAHVLSVDVLPDIDQDLPRLAQRVDAFELCGPVGGAFLPAGTIVADSPIAQQGQEEHEQGAGGEGSGADVLEQGGGGDDDDGDDAAGEDAAVAHNTDHNNNDDVGARILARTIALHVHPRSRFNAQFLTRNTTPRLRSLSLTSCFSLTGLASVSHVHSLFLLFCTLGDDIASCPFVDLYGCDGELTVDGSSLLQLNGATMPRLHARNVACMKLSRLQGTESMQLQSTCNVRTCVVKDCLIRDFAPFSGVDRLFLHQCVFDASAVSTLPRVSTLHVSACMRSFVSREPWPNTTLIGRTQEHLLRTLLTSTDT